MANLGEKLCGRIEEGKTASIRADPIQYKAKCQSSKACQLVAVIQIECRDCIRHPLWNRDFCDAHAAPVLEKSRGAGITIFNQSRVGIRSKVGMPSGTR